MEFLWLQENALVLAFYLAVGLLIYFNRKKFEFQGIVLLLKTKLGIAQMKKFATPLSERKNFFGARLFTISTIALIISTFFMLFQIFASTQNDLFFLIVRLIFVVSFLTLCISIIFFRQIKLAGTMGIYVGFLGMLFMIGLIGVGVYQLFFDPLAPPMFSPVLPGISIPGSPLKLPLFEGLIALLIVVIIHEFSHGVVSKAYKVPIKSSGFVMFGPIPGAFVEPDEKKLAKASSKAQLSVYGAGPFSNMLLAGLIMILLAFLSLLTVSIYEPAGVRIEGFVNSDNLDERGLSNLEVGEVITMVNNVSVSSNVDLLLYLQDFSPGDRVYFISDKANTSILLSSDPRNESRPYIGVFLDNEVVGKTRLAENGIFQEFYFWFIGNPYSTNLNNNLGLLWLVFVLSFGIGIVNLLPVGPLDGGRMIFLVMRDKFGKKRAEVYLHWLSKILLFLVIVLVLIPIFRAIF